MGFFFFFRWNWKDIIFRIFYTISLVFHFLHYIDRYLCINFTSKTISTWIHFPNITSTEFHSLRACFNSFTLLICIIIDTFNGSIYYFVYILWFVYKYKSPQTRLVHASPYHGAELFSVLLSKRIERSEHTECSGWFYREDIISFVEFAPRIIPITHTNTPSHTTYTPIHIHRQCVRSPPPSPPHLDLV